MKLSREKIEKICEQIIYYLYSVHPRLVFTSHVAREMARDEEFTKKLLLDLKKKKIITEVRKNPEGLDYKKRSRWKLSDASFRIYDSRS